MDAGDASALAGGATGAAVHVRTELMALVDDICMSRGAAHSSALTLHAIAAAAAFDALLAARPHAPLPLLVGRRSLARIDALVRTVDVLIGASSASAPLTAQLAQAARTALGEMRDWADECCYSRFWTPRRCVCR